MKIPNEIVNKMEQVNKLMSEIYRWMYDNLDKLDGSKYEHTSYLSYKYDDYYQFTDKPTGKEQSDGEYCEQWECGECGDWFQGYYYYPTEKGNYFYFDYDI